MRYISKGSKAYCIDCTVHSPALVHDAVRLISETVGKEKEKVTLLCHNITHNDIVIRMIPSSLSENTTSTTLYGFITGI